MLNPSLTLIVGDIIQKIVVNAIVPVAVNVLAKVLGLVREDDSVEDLGDKALQAEASGIVPERYASYEEYVREVEKFEINLQESIKFTPRAKMEKGFELSANVIQEYIGIDGAVINLLELVLEGVPICTVSKMSELGKILKEDKNAISILVSFLDKSELNDTKIAMGMDILTRMEKAENPTLSDIEARRHVMNMRRK